MITITDYGVGNLESIKNMLKKTDNDSIISSNVQEIEAATKLILPGVGAFDTCAAKLQQSGLVQAINNKVLNDKIPILGVCVGFQLLFPESEEGSLPGLGWIEGKVVKFKRDQLPESQKIPHMGWADIKLAKSSPLFANMNEDPRFYFVHSYYPEIINERDALLFATYGYRFVAGIERKNILGVQFHPEKSHKFGMRLLDNFVKNY